MVPNYPGDELTVVDCIIIPFKRIIQATDVLHVRRRRFFLSAHCVIMCAVQSAGKSALG